MNSAPPDLGDLVAEVTLYFHWGPHDAFGLTVTELNWWCAHANRSTAKGS